MSVTYAVILKMGNRTTVPTAGRRWMVETMYELKPCPFCACGAKAYQTYDGKWQVECFVCHARSWWADTKEEAEAKWNKREKSWKDGET